ncbi:DUF2948 family protein [Desertibaculum subflavum]|uniref:DUF2948 family protein n=1 Tax=Desertibaculum subflavum TaxID=2268458 RepID=UPI000E6648C0
MAAARLQLQALDLEDLAALDEAVRGAQVRVGNIGFEPKRHRFAIVLDRHGMASGLHFEGVLKAASRGFDRDDPEAQLELRAIGCEPGSDAAATVVLAFAGGASIRLDVECIEAYLADLPAAERS